MEKVITQCVCEICKKVFHVTHEIHADVQSVLYEIYDAHDKIRTEECKISMLNLRVLNRVFYPKPITYDVWLKCEKFFAENEPLIKDFALNCSTLIKMLAEYLHKNS